MPRAAPSGSARRPFSLPWPTCRRGRGSRHSRSASRSTPCSRCSLRAASSGMTAGAAPALSTCATQPRRPTLSDRVLVELAGPDADHAFDCRDEYLAVADLSSLGGLDDGVDATLGVAILDDDLYLHLGKKVDHIFRAAVELGVTLLPAEALDLGHREARYADLGQRLANFLKLERLDDRRDLFHGLAPKSSDDESSLGQCHIPASPWRRRGVRGSATGLPAST